MVLRGCLRHYTGPREAIAGCRSVDVFPLEWRRVEGGRTAATAYLGKVPGTAGNLRLVGENQGASRCGYLPSCVYYSGHP